jgi:hypothetical protein
MLAHVETMSEEEAQRLLGPVPQRTIQPTANDDYRREAISYGA